MDQKSPTKSLCIVLPSTAQVPPTPLTPPNLNLPVSIMPPPLQPLPLSRITYDPPPLSIFSARFCAFLVTYLEQHDESSATDCMAPLAANLAGWYSTGKIIAIAAGAGAGALALMALCVVCILKCVNNKVAARARTEKPKKVITPQYAQPYWEQNQKQVCRCLPPALTGLSILSLLLPCVEKVHWEGKCRSSEIMDESTVDLWNRDESEMVPLPPPSPSESSRRQVGREDHPV